MEDTLRKICGDADELKERIWAWIDAHHVPVQDKDRMKEATNGFLDELDCLSDHATKES